MDFLQFSLRTLRAAVCGLRNPWILFSSTDVQSTDVRTFSLRTSVYGLFSLGLQSTDFSNPRIRTDVQSTDFSLRTFQSYRTSVYRLFESTDSKLFSLSRSTWSRPQTDCAESVPRILSNCGVCSFLDIMVMYAPLNINHDFFRIKSAVHHWLIFNDG